MHIEKTSLLMGLRAAKANLIPGLLLQSVMVCLVISYNVNPSVHAWLAFLASAKRDGGFPFSFISSSLAGGVLPEVLTIALLQQGRINVTNIRNLMFAIPFWGIEGLTVDLFYRFQSILFGSGVDPSTVIKKVLFDMLVYTPFYATPVGVACYEWKNQRYSFRKMSRVLTVPFYKKKSVPALIACWGLWIPLVSVIYSTPLPLQFPLFVFGLTFWVMLFNTMTAANCRKTGLSFSGAVGDAPRLES